MAGNLLPLVYDELRRLAAQLLAHEAPGQILQPTALVHDAWLRIAQADPIKWNGRAHFFGAAAGAMRRILIENARRRNALRNAGEQIRLPGDADGLQLASPSKDDELLAVDEALELFSRRDPQKAQLVILRYFAGFTLEEAAEVLGISVPTASRWWTYSRAWLCAEIEQRTLGSALGTPPSGRRPTINKIF
jgi:RNA polymerase sigma factor (TIGR02999 family)